MMNTRIFSFPRLATPLAISLCLTGAVYGQATGSKSSGNNPATTAGQSSRPAPSSSTYDATTSRSSTSSGAMGSTRGEKLGWMERRFVTKAAEGGQDEVELAQLAAQKASNPDVRSFAERLVKDHTEVNSELMGIATRKDVKVDQDENHDRTYRRLSAKSGDEFDREFIEHMVDEHEKDIKMFEQAASDAKDTDLRSFASKHLPHLREHLAQAQRLQQSIVPTGRMDTDSNTSPSSRSSTSTSPSASNSTRNPDTTSSPTTAPETGASSTGGKRTPDSSTPPGK